MIVFDLACRVGGHRFEGWFGSTEDYETQQASGLLVCPVCGSGEVAKAVMAPNLARKGNQIAEPARPRPVAPVAAGGRGTTPVANAAPPLPPKAAALLQAIAVAQAEAIKSSRWVGDSFADQARAMHYGEREHELIHGQTTPGEARELLEEGVPVAPLLIPVVPPDQAN